MLPPNLKSRFDEAIGHHRAGRLDRAESIYRTLAAMAPKEAGVFELWGRLAAQQGRVDEAIRLLTIATQLNPHAVGAAVQLALLLVGKGRVAQGETLLRGVTTRVPNVAEGWIGLAHMLKLQGKLVEALACNERAIKAEPKSASAWHNVGLTLAHTGANFRAMGYHRRALELDPKYMQAHYGLAQCFQKTYRQQEALAEYELFLKANPRHLEARSYRLFALENQESITRETLFAEHVAYGELIGRGPEILPGYDYSSDRRIRLAILSPDLRTHSCAYFLEPLLRGLDAAQFELYLYHDHFFEDATSARLRGMAAVWRNFVGLPDSAVERIIREDKVDVLIDLAGHVSNSVRLPMLARRVAPVQITYLGYPDTTGVPAMDFRFTDPIADPPGDADRFAVEKLVRFAPTAWCYQPAPEAPAVSAPPCTTGEPLTFGCFNSPTKFTDALFRAWAQILAQVPGSRLLLKARDFHEPEVRDHMLGRLQRQGVPLDRVQMLARTLGTGEHLAQYAKVDVALDTFPYNGTTTTCEALWMGRPVVTLCGDRHAARVGASLLTAIGRRDWVAENSDAYVRIATGLAANPAGLGEIATALRAQMQQSVLLDQPTQSARFAAAVRACWISRCRMVNPAATAA